MDADERRKLAIRRLKQKQAFRNHLFIYAAVNVLLVIIWAMSGASFFWPIFPMVFWGFGVVMHAWSTYGGGVTGAITESDIRREMERIGDPDSVAVDLDSD